jgi:hypothetical protein
VRRLIVALVLLSLTACGSVKYGGGTQPLTTPELKYRLIDTIGAPLFCGPPVVRMPSDGEAGQEVAALRTQDPDTFAAIVRHEKLDAAHLTANDERRVLEQADVLRALRLTPEGQLFRFDYIAGRPSPEHVVGTIDSHGAISLESHDSTQFPGRGGCPICLAATARVATPDGEIPVADLHAGMLVWTIDAGRRVPAPISVVGHTRAPFGHRVIRVVLADGRAVVASRPRSRFPTSAIPGTCCRSAQQGSIGPTTSCSGAPWPIACLDGQRTAINATFRSETPK